MLTCSNCGRDNPDDFNFCGQCGAPLPHEVACPSCGHDNPPGFSFCRNCGGALAATDGNGAGRGDGQPQQVGDGRYVIERFIGEGVRKMVYLAHDTALDRDVAVGLVKTAGLDAGNRGRVRRVRVPTSSLASALPL